MDQSGPTRYRLPELASIRPELRYAYRGLVPGHGQTGRYSPAWFSCWLIESGWGEADFGGGRRVRAHEGEWLLSPPYAPRDQSFPRDAQIISVAFSLSLPAGMDPHQVLPLIIRDGTTAARLQTVALPLIRALSNSASPDLRRERYPDGLDLATWLEVHQHLSTFVATWYRAWGNTESTASPVIDSRVQLARTVIGLDARMGPVPFEHIQERTGLSRVHVDRLFRTTLGHSPKEELDRRILERVLRRLADPQRALKSIAHELAFADSSHLCRWFRRRTGHSPERYRRAVPA